MEMKPARPVRDRLALQADAVWRYQRGEVTVPIPLTEVRAVSMVLRAASLHTCLETGEPLFDLMEDIQHVLDRMIISRLAGPTESFADAAYLDREFPTIKAILEGL